MCWACSLSQRLTESGCRNCLGSHCEDLRKNSNGSLWKPRREIDANCIEPCASCWSQDAIFAERSNKRASGRAFGSRAARRVSCCRQALDPLDQRNGCCLDSRSRLRVCVCEQGTCSSAALMHQVLSGAGDAWCFHSGVSSSPFLRKSHQKFRCAVTLTSVSVVLDLEFRYHWAQQACVTTALSFCSLLHPHHHLLTGSSFFSLQQALQA